MNLFKLERQQVLPISAQQAWDYFSNPMNLAEITPPKLSLSIKGALHKKIHNGMLIQYTVKPLLGIQMPWVSEIKHVNAPYSFVDEQRVGPYKFWYHQHYFHSLGKNSVEVIDCIYYALPLRPLAYMLDSLIVRHELEIIFNFRRQVLKKKFMKERSYDISK